MEKKKLLKNSNEYINFNLKNDSNKLFAVHKKEYAKILQLKDEYFNKKIPDNYTIEAFKMDKIGTDSKIDMYDIIDQNPVICKVNDLIECISEIRFLS